MAGELRRGPLEHEGWNVLGHRCAEDIRPRRFDAGQQRGRQSNGVAPIRRQAGGEQKATEGNGQRRQREKVDLRRSDRPWKPAPPPRPRESSRRGSAPARSPPAPDSSPRSPPGLPAPGAPAGNAATARGGAIRAPPGRAAMNSSVTRMGRSGSRCRARKSRPSRIAAAEIAGRRSAATLGGVRADDGSRGEDERLSDGEPAKTEQPVAERDHELKQPVNVDPGPSGRAHRERVDAQQGPAPPHLVAGGDVPKDVAVGDGAERDRAPRRSPPRRRRAPVGSARMGGYPRLTTSTTPSIASARSRGRPSPCAPACRSGDRPASRARPSGPARGC